MLADINTLLEIQALDREAQELNAQLAKYPVVWEEVKRKLAKKKEAMERLQSDQDRHVKERRRVEQKLRLFSDDLRKAQAQANQVKTAREYEAINKQIEAVKKKIAQAEEQGIALIDKTGELEKQSAAAALDYEKTKEFYLKEKDRIRDQFNEKKKQVANLATERAKLTAKVDAKILASYERVNLRYPGNGVVPVARAGAHSGPTTGKAAEKAKQRVEERTCTGCNWQVLPDLLVKVHQADSIVTCTNCGRILSEDMDYDPTLAESAAEKG